MGGNSTQHQAEPLPEPLFLGNQLTLDFVNTRPFIDGQLIELLPDFAALLRWFREAYAARRRHHTRTKEIASRI